MLSHVQSFIQQPHRNLIKEKSEVGCFTDVSGRMSLLILLLSENLFEVLFKESEQ